MNAKIERWYPLIVGILIAIIHHLVLRKYSFPLGSPGEVKDLFSAVVNLSAITIGFLSTAQSILLSMGNNRIIKQLKLQGGKKYIRLINFLMDAVSWSFFLAIISTIGLIANPKFQELWNSLYFSFWLFVLVTTALSYYRIIYLFSKILRS